MKPGRRQLILASHGLLLAGCATTQAISYMTGHSTIIVSGANETTNLSFFSVGRGNAVNTRPCSRTSRTNPMPMSPWSRSPARTASSTAPARRTASYFATTGMTGFYAPNVQFQGPVFVGDINASDTAGPVFIIGSGTDARVRAANCCSRTTGPSRSAASPS